MGLHSSLRDLTPPAPGPQQQPSDSISVFRGLNHWKRVFEHDTIPATPSRISSTIKATIKARHRRLSRFVPTGGCRLLVRISECWWHKNGKELNRPHPLPGLSGVYTVKPGSRYEAHTYRAINPALWHWIRRHEQRAGGKARQWRRTAGPVWSMHHFQLSSQEARLRSNPPTPTAAMPSWRMDGWRKLQRWISIHFFSG